MTTPKEITRAGLPGFFADATLPPHKPLSGFPVLPIVVLPMPEYKPGPDPKKEVTLHVPPGTPENNVLNKDNLTLLIRTLIKYRERMD